jgi:hypothetical protein
MTIRNLDAFIEAMWDWGILMGGFGPVIQPSDLDGCVERNGQFLILEAKSKGAPLKIGQRLTYMAMARRGFFVIVVWGRKDNPEECVTFTPNNPQGSDKQPCDIDRLRTMCHRWYEWACKNPFDLLR